MLKKLVTMKKRGYNLRNKGKMNNLGNKKIKTSRMEDNNVYQIQPHQFSIACKQASTATKIIDIAQKYSKKSLFLNIGVRIYNFVRPIKVLFVVELNHNCLMFLFYIFIAEIS